MKLERDVKELSECSFKPQLCRKSIEITRGKEKIESKADKIQKLKQKKIENLK